MVERRINEMLYKAVGSLPEIQRRRFLLYYEYEFNLYQIAAMVALHRFWDNINLLRLQRRQERREIEEISPTVTDTALKRICFLFGWHWRHPILSLFWWGGNRFFKEVNAYVQRKTKTPPERKKAMKS